MFTESRYNAFVSSTFDDLEGERLAVIDVLTRLGILPIAMEHTGTSPNSPEEVSFQRLARAHLYVGIVAGRYGSGITEEEYRRAVERRLPRFIYFKAENSIHDDDKERDPEKVEKLKSLRDELLKSPAQTHDLQPFRTPDELAKKVVTDIHNWLKQFEQKVIDSLTDAAKAAQVTPTNLHEVPQFRAYAKRAPLMSGAIREIVAKAMRELEDGKKVLILGEPGIGKTTVLYLICRSLLLKGHRLFRLDRDVEGLGPADILLRDNLDSELARTLAEDWTNAAIATCREENWDSRGERDWTTLRLLREHFPREILRAILEDCLSMEGVQHTDEGVEEALTRCQGLPGYLAELARSCRASGQALRKEAAHRAPADFIDLIQAAVRSVQDLNTLTLLYALALSAKSRLHRIHLEALMTGDGAVSSAPLPAHFEALVVRDAESVFSLGHDLWRDVLLRPWSSLGGSGPREPDSLQSLREDSTVADQLKTSFSRSIPLLLKLKGLSAAAAVRVALENEPSMLPDLERSVMESGFEMAHLVTVLDLLAVADPAGIKERYRTGSQTVPPGAFVLVLWAETLGFRSDRYVSLGSKDSDGKGLVCPALPTDPEFIAPAYQALLLDEAADCLSKDPETGPDIRARLFSDLGAVKAILGRHDESLEALRRAADEWRLVCCSEEDVFKGAPVKFQQALDKLGVELLAAGKDEEALRCLQAAVGAVRLIREGHSIMMRTPKETDAIGNTKYTLSGDLQQELSALVSVFQNMPDSVSFAEASEARELVPDFLPPDSPFVTSMEEIRALASSLGPLAKALTRTGRTTESHRLLHGALTFKNRLAFYYKNKEDLSALANVLIEMSSLAPGLAGRALREALEIYRRLATQEDGFIPKLAETLDLLAERSLDRQARDEAISLWTEAEKILQGLASIHPRFVIPYSRIAATLALVLSSEDPARAIDYFHRAEASLENLSPTGQQYLTLIAQVTWGLGNAYEKLRNWDKAIEYYRKAELDWVAVDSLESQGVEMRLHGLIDLGTALLVGKRQPESALEPLAKAVEILKGQHDPKGREASLATALDRLGSAKEATGDRAGALDCYSEAQAILRRPSADEPHYAAGLGTNLLKIAKLKHEMGRQSEAEDDLGKAEEICLKFVHSPAAPNEEVGFLFANLGKAYKDFDNNARSATCYQIALRQLQRLTEIDHRLGGAWAEVLNEYARVLNSDRRFEDLVATYRGSSDFLRKLYDSKGLFAADLAATLRNLGYWLAETGSTERAIAAYEEAEAILARFPRGSETSALDALGLGGVCQVVEKW